MKKIVTTLLLFLILTTSFTQADEIIVDGIKRSYTLYNPEEIDSKSLPLLIVLHGGGGTGEGMIKLTDFNDYADEYGFIIVYPDGIEKHWNDKRDVNIKYVKGKEVDDIKFLTCLIDTLVAKNNIDSNRVFVTGISNGGIMSFYLSLEVPEKFAGAAIVAASMPPFMYYGYNDTSPIPMMIIFGDEDPLIPFDGGEISLWNIKRGKVVSVKNAVNFWVKKNNCNEEPDVTYINKKMDKTKAIKYVYSPKHDGAEVVYWLLKGGGHTWPGGPQYQPKLIVGITSREIDASEEILKFFKSVPK